MPRSLLLLAAAVLAPALGSALAPGAARAQTVAVGDVAAQAARAAAPAAPAERSALDARVALAVAERWGVEGAAVRVEWPHGAPEAGTYGDGAVGLLGSGAGGTWVAELPPAREGEPVVRVRVRTTALLPRPVAARDLRRGETLAAGDIEVQRVAVAGPAPALDVAEGWRARRRIAAGELLEPPAVEPPQLVTAGDGVTVVFRRAALSLTLGGTALGTGAEGERVRVRTETGERLEGVIVGPGRVEVEN